jgi:hypothetical protein
MSSSVRMQSRSVQGRSKSLQKIIQHGEAFYSRLISTLIELLYYIYAVMWKVPRKRNSRLLRINGPPAISVVPSSVRMLGKIKTASKDGPVQWIVYISALEHIHQFLRMSHGVGRLKVAEISVFTGQLIPTAFRSFLILALHTRQDQNLFHKRSSLKHYSTLSPWAFWLNPWASSVAWKGLRCR